MLVTMRRVDDELRVAVVEAGGVEEEGEGGVGEGGCSLRPLIAWKPSPSGGDERRLRTAGGCSCLEERPAGPEGWVGMVWRRY
jgi:hypothetical protein